MSWRTVVITSSSKLDYQMGFLVVRKKDIVKIHLNEIALLIIESTAVSMTTALLCELTKKKVIFCDEKRNPSSELVGYYGSHDTSAKVRSQIGWDLDICRDVWTMIVLAKIEKQAEHLASLNREEARLLYDYMQEIMPGDESNREGHAAKVYFNALFGMEFSRSSECNINAALNYGYSILLSSFNRCITANGYLTQLGLWHSNIFNPFNLASDLMEPFRPIVDRKVKGMVLNKFEHEEKMDVLSFLQYEVMIADRREYVDNAIKVYCKSVFDAIEAKDPSMIKLYSYEL